MSKPTIRWGTDNYGRRVVDEIVGAGDLHLEMLSDTQAMLRFGKDGECMVTIFVDPKGRLQITGLQDGECAHEYGESPQKPIAPFPYFWAHGFNMDTWRAK